MPEKQRIYFVYEIDSHRSHISRAVKGIFLNAEKAVAEYDSIKKEWEGSPDYMLCVGYIEETDKAEFDEDIMRDMQEIDSTEE